MSNYEKPVVVVADDVAEGVFMASGSATATPDKTEKSATYTIVKTNAWDGNKQYNISFTNNTNEKLSEISVTVTCVGNVTSIGGNVSGEIYGNTAKVTFRNYGNGIGPHQSYNDIYMSVTGTGDFDVH